MHEHGFYNFAWPMFWALFALSFWGVRMWIRHRERMKALDTARSLLEKGVVLPSELSEALKPQAPRTPTPQHDLRAGVILVAVAVAMMVFAGLLPESHSLGGVHPLYGIAAFPGLIGLVLIGFWWFSRNRTVR